MAPPSKLRKQSKGGSPSHIITLKVPTKFLRSLEPAAPIKEEVQEAKAVKEIKEDTPSKDSSSTSSNTIPVAAPNGSAEKPVDSPTSTPIPNGTPVPSLMPPPTEGVKKRGVKRTSGVALGPDGLPKPRGKPGPKKKARLEDGSIDHSNTTPRAPNGTAHKLGPKANQGAINAGLRALDRTGKPCRKWQKGTFKVKSFTGIIWELPRWKAPPKVRLDGVSEGSASGESSKENKDNSQIESERSEKSINPVVDVEMVNGKNIATSPAPSLPDSSAPTAPVAPATPIVTASA